MKYGIMIRNIRKKNTTHNVIDIIIIHLVSKNIINKRGRVWSNSGGTCDHWNKSIAKKSIIKIRS